MAGPAGATGTPVTVTSTQLRFKEGPNANPSGLQAELDYLKVDVSKGPYTELGVEYSGIINMTGGAANEVFNALTGNGYVVTGEFSADKMRFVDSNG